mgnify:CR=1 FL=1
MSVGDIREAWGFQNMDVLGFIDPPMNIRGVFYKKCIDNIRDDEQTIHVLANRHAL